MSEINITKLFDDDMAQYAASIAEIGDNAGRITWNNAVEYSKDNPLGIVADDAREYLADFGAWSKEELSDMIDNEIHALILQFIAGDIREVESLCADDNGEIDWREYEEQVRAGRTSGNIYKSCNGEIYFMMSH